MALVGNEMLVPLDHSIDGKPIVAKARLNKGDQWVKLDLSTCIKAEDPGNQRSRRAKDLIMLY